MRVLVVLFAAVLIVGCGGEAPKSSSAAVPKELPARVRQFYATDTKIPKGLKGTLCYGVENAQKVELMPAVEDVWPSSTRCFDVSPRESTKYSLTAIGADGTRDTKSVQVTVGAAPPRLFDLSVNSVLVHPGDQVVVCFKVENTISVKASPGHFDPQRNCVTDQPKKTTSYKISALGADRQVDSGTVTVKVH